ncbi:hypothetical protein EC912_102471 [Luteibacter rhizovicinus]|uniref:Uncharacterized protein n=1 Tax=Luteibacter rhizovicinus TaxID=242606 RepID=A0A4R3YU73_9GAMM|nr:hypothetical protein [Luteibacter rhizovicinus]TCV96121.1 hypothetical protein EC912_102471 [Luteibacter rhizovicinus]
MPTTHRYYLSVADLANARGSEPSLAFEGIGPEKLASDLADALRSDTLFQQWKAMQPDPDEVAPSLGATDPGVSATGKQTSDRADIELVTTLPMSIVKQRLNWLIGPNWQLRDMR